MSFSRDIQHVNDNVLCTMSWWEKKNKTQNKWCDVVNYIGYYFESSIIFSFFFIGAFISFLCFIGLWSNVQMYCINGCSILNCYKKLKGITFLWEKIPRGLVLNKTNVHCRYFIYSKINWGRFHEYNIKVWLLMKKYTVIWLILIFMEFIRRTSHDWS